jgi:UDP-glucose 4-epimerase
MEIEGKKIFITGGCGFIGSHLVARYLKEGASEIVIYDNLSTGFESYLSGLDVTVIKGDILDYERLKDAMKGCDIVSHHAAELEVFNGIENSVHELQVNIQGTLHVLNAAMKEGIKKVLFASSGAVYGQAQSIPQDISHPFNPHWPYGVSKLAAEKYCTQYSLLYGLNTVSFRYGIVFGPHEWYGRVLTLFIKRVLEGKPPVIFGTGDQRRDFVYVDDVVECNILATLSDSYPNGKAYNVGGVSHVNVKDIAQAVIEVIDPKIEPIFDNPEPGQASKYQPDRKRLPGELVDFILNNSETTKDLGYTPKVDLKTGVKKEVEWLKKNPGQWNYAPRV